MIKKGFRVVITGKGGAGKTTLTALLCHLFAKGKYKVLAVDEDPQMNLPYALGLPQETCERIVPLSENADYIEEKVGARPGEGWGAFLSLNPSVDDVVERFGFENKVGVKLLVMGTVTEAGKGCLCPENALLAAVMQHIDVRENETILMDTQAGVELLSSAFRSSSFTPFFSKAAFRRSIGSDFSRTSWTSSRLRYLAGSDMEWPR